MYRVMGKPYPGPWNFKHHPWLKAMHDSKAELNVGMKAAQMGYTEMLLNWTFYSIDILNESVLYTLPTDDNASDFSSARFDSALDLSPHLTNLFSDVKNTKHKRAGGSNLYIRGSRSKSNLISVPVAKVALDEVNKMVVDHIPLVLERMSGQLNKQAWMISTPTVPHFGINMYYDVSTMEHYFFKCPCCSRHEELLFPDNVVICGTDANDPSVKESHLICHHCKGTLPHQTKHEWLLGDWVISNQQANSRGFYINQLYSSTVSPSEIVAQYFKAQVNPADEQEFYNSKLGLGHLVEGARINADEIKDCTAGYSNGCNSDNSKIVTMGVDVGKWLHVEIMEWHPTGESGNMHQTFIPKAIYIGKVVDFTELDTLIYKYAINHTVIDANPERREALKFAYRFPGLVDVCFYGRDQKSREIVVGKEIPSITVDRTSWMELAMSRFSSKRVRIPMDTPFEYKEHISAVAKIYERDTDGNPTAKFINMGPDHYAHAHTYAEIAFSRAASVGSNKNTSGVY